MKSGKIWEKEGSRGHLEGKRKKRKRRRAY
jgi:hypothetical protein